MIAAVVVILFSIIPGMMIAEAIANRRRLNKWRSYRVVLDDAQFLAMIGDIQASREAVLRVREEIGRATKIPANLIAANDEIQELETVGRPTHFSVIDYFTDVLAEAPKDEYSLITVRDYVVEFVPQLK